NDGLVCIEVRRGRLIRIEVRRDRHGWRDRYGWRGRHAGCEPHTRRDPATAVRLAHRRRDRLDGRLHHRIDNGLDDRPDLLGSGGGPGCALG
ncbi:MAG: hypothetical protein J2P22_14895, partial [Nocardioides sp.]|nr:hypothetical protein [Nocardioides sp.]